MFPYNATDIIHVLNTDLVRMLERDRWRRERPEIYPPERSVLDALQGLRRRLTRTSNPE